MIVDFGNVSFELTIKRGSLVKQASRHRSFVHRTGIAKYPRPTIALYSVAAAYGTRACDQAWHNRSMVLFIVEVSCNSAKGRMLHTWLLGPDVHKYKSLPP